MSFYDMLFLFKCSCGSYLLYLKHCFSFTFQTLPVICWALFRASIEAVFPIYIAWSTTFFLLLIYVIWLFPDFFVPFGSQNVIYGIIWLNLVGHFKHKCLTIDSWVIRGKLLGQFKQYVQTWNINSDNQIQSISILV